jgi:hypothetical protein
MEHSRVARVARFHIGYILEGLGMEYVGIFYDRLEYYTAI